MTGRIVLIRLSNFMSYDDIELHPGPHLNLIIGPNGTGKSTFVCAVILGLGGKVKTLGRGDHVSSYIKNGCNESIIEIELYEPKGDNIVIKRKISFSNRSEFYINSKPASTTQVDEIRAKYNIHLDNLCTFLPQEKVQDFSKLNPQQLLSQTQKTVGSETMMAAYDRLKIYQNHVKETMGIIGGLEGQLENERQKNDRLRDKVKSYLEKRALCDKLTLISQKKSWLCYHNELKKMKDLAKIHKLEEQKFTKERETYSKLLEEFEHLEAGNEKAIENVTKAKKDCAAKISAIENEQKKFQEQVEELKNFDNILKSKLAEEETKKQELKQHQEYFDKLKNDLETFESKNGTDNDIREKEAEINKQLAKCHEESSALAEKKADFEDKLESVNLELKNISAEYRLLERRRNFRLEYIKRYEPDVYKSVEWLKEHKHLFRGHIYNPMLLEIDVIDPKIAKYVEARIGYRDLISFTCTNPDDLNTLIRNLRIEQKLKVNAICSEDDDTTQYSPEIHINQIKSLGFFSYMKDLITGPNHIIRFLCKVYKIHSIPVGDETVKSKCDKVPISIPIFFSENHMFTVKVSVYSGDKSINVRQLNEPKLFSVPLENEKLEKLIEREKELKESVEKYQMKVNLVTQHLKSSSEIVESIRQKKREAATLLEEKKHILLKLKRAEQNLKAVQDSLKDPEEILRRAEEEQNNLKKDINRRLKNMRDMFKSLETVSNKKNECEVKYKVLRLKINKMQQIKTDRLGELRNLETNVSNLKREKENKQIYCSQLKEAAKKLTNGISPGEKGFAKFEDKFKTLKNTVEELETEAEETQVMADFLQAGDAQVVQEFDKREQEIAKMVTSLEEAKSNLEKYKDVVSKSRDEWLNPINELVSNINENFGNFFQSMGCVGEISLISGENKDDFDQYGISIKVKFRDEVPLQVLGRHFQSGGERAVATAVYLLSLQKLISVPFRFVDEINQGMDSANERRIMNLLIDVTSEEDSSQYFFITPKLLPKIECSETTVTHCIYSGPKTISSKSWNLQKFLSCV